MTHKKNNFTFSRHILPNGLTALVFPMSHVPRVDVHLGYHVGSKDEGDGEHGIAHVIEHMLFKGTTLLSESDINLVCQKLSCDANAFTSRDYTYFTFHAQNNVLDIIMKMLADCMCNATFDTHTFLSERKAIIEEVRMYKDDYHGVLIEHLFSSMFYNHPYQVPIIGTEHEIMAITREKLFAFYKKHYHPANATLIVVGDVKPEDVFDMAEKQFGHISNPTCQNPKHHPYHHNVANNLVTLHRQTSVPWCTMAFPFPGLYQELNHIPAFVGNILANSKSSRLYTKLVEEKKLVIDIDCAMFDFYESSIFFINYYPADFEKIAVIDDIIMQECENLGTTPVEEWELEAARKSITSDLVASLENGDRLASLMGHLYLAQGNPSALDDYYHAFLKTTAHDLVAWSKKNLTTAHKNCGVLVPSTKTENTTLEKIKKQEELEINALLEQQQRITPVEEGRFVHTIKNPQMPHFIYPKPVSFVLENELECLYHDNPVVPHISGILSFKINHWHEPKGKDGIFYFLLSMLADSSKEYSPQKLAKLLESEGIFIGATTEGLVFRCLAPQLETTIKMLYHLVTCPGFSKDSFEKIRTAFVTSLQEFWDNPIDCIDFVAKKVVYQDHPFHKNPLGDINTLTSITIKDLKKFYSDYISPHGTNIVIVGDISTHNVPNIIKKYFGNWQGKNIHDDIIEKIPAYKRHDVIIPMDRNQTAIGFVSPSIERHHPDFTSLAIIDTILTGGPMQAPAARLFQLREKKGLFYALEGSLLQGVGLEQRMMFIKTLVAPEMVEVAIKDILDVIHELGKNGVTNDEFLYAKNAIFAASVELFENSWNTAQTFLFLKKMKLSFNLFDKQGEILSIIEIEQVDEVARRYCSPQNFSIIKIGK